MLRSGRGTTHGSAWIRERRHIMAATASRGCQARTPRRPWGARLDGRAARTGLHLQRPGGQGRPGRQSALQSHRGAGGGARRQRARERPVQPQRAAGVGARPSHHSRGHGKAVFADGVGDAKRFRYPVGIDVDSQGLIYVADIFKNYPASRPFHLLAAVMDIFAAGGGGEGGPAGALELKSTSFRWRRACFVPFHRDFCVPCSARDVGCVSRNKNRQKERLGERGVARAGGWRMLAAGRPLPQTAIAGRGDEKVCLSSCRHMP